MKKGGPKAEISGQFTKVTKSLIDKRNKPFWSEQKRSANNFECKYLDVECKLMHMFRWNTHPHSIAKKFTHALTRILQVMEDLYLICYCRLASGSIGYSQCTVRDYF